MKPNEYIKKYKLDTSSRFNHEDFVNDMKIDFMNLFEITFDYSGKANIAGYENTVRAIRQKWDSINAKTGGAVPDKLWNYFYASFIAKTREELFPHEMASRRKRKSDYKKRMEWEEEQFRGFFEGFWDHIFRNIKSSIDLTSSYISLGLTKGCSKEDVKAKYRELSKKHHPDKGGNRKKFHEITEAKNKLLGAL
jgi:hypothetical protein